MQTPGRFPTPPTNPAQWLFSGEAWRTINTKQILLFVLSPVLTAVFCPQYMVRMCSRVFVSDHRASYPESAVNTLLDPLMAKCTRYFGAYADEKYVQLSQDSCLSCIRRVSLSDVPIPLSPAQPTWSLPSNARTPPETARAQTQVLILCTWDLLMAFCSLSCQPTPEAVRSVIPKPSFLNDMTPPSRHSLRPTPVHCLPLSTPVTRPHLSI